MNQTNKDIGRNIRSIRASLNMTQTAFGELFGLEKASVSKYEAGDAKRGVPAEYLIKIAKLGNITVDELITGKKTETVNENLGDYAQHKPLSEMDKRFLATFHNLDPRDYNAAIEFLNTMAQTSPYPQRGNVDEKTED